MRIWPFGSRAEKNMLSAGDAENLRWFWHGYLKSKTPMLLLVAAMVLAQGLVYQQFLSLTESGLRVIFDNGASHDLIKVCLLVFGLFAARGVLSYLVPRLSVVIASDAVMRMRRDMIDHYMRLDLSFFEKTPSGEIILRLVNQADALAAFVGPSTANAARNAATVVIVSAYLIYQSPLLFSAAIIVLPCIVLLMESVSGRIKALQRKAENALGDYMTGIEVMASGMRTVKISSQEPEEKRRLLKATEGIRTLGVRLQISQALVMPIMDLVSAFVYVLVIGGGGYLALQPGSDLDGAAIITFLVGMVLVFDPARMLAQFFAQLQGNLIILDSVRSIHRIEPQIVNAENPVLEFDTTGDIAFSGVDFGYDESAPLFSGLDMTFEGGKVTAIVGATGSGKTTLLSLMTRLYDVQNGQITLGGTPIEQIDIRSLRSSFSVVAQDIVIFNSSIWENIKYVRPEASDAEVWQAAENAEIADLIRERGDAPLGPKGSQLSGGQKQRIAIARAFLRSAPILLLDEATSALDQRTEDKVRTALARLSKGKTTIIVAHRLSSVTMADKIFVLDNGHVVEAGKHDALVAQGGLYAAMFGAQKQSYD